MQKTTTEEEMAAHATSLVRAAQLMYQSGWNSGLWSLLSECGGMLAPVLRASPDFQAWSAGSQHGRDFARGSVFAKKRSD